MTKPRDGYERLCALAVKAGIAAVQLRAKQHHVGNHTLHDYDEREEIALARRLRSLTKGSETLFIVNDNAKIAIESDADGLHIGQDDITATEARMLIGADKILGLSTHNLSQVRAANSEPVDYIGFGPLYTTTSKVRPDPVVGPAALAEAYRISSHPIVAIGGLDLDRIQALDAHAHNVAVIRAVSDSADPLTAMRTLEAAYLQKSAPCLC
jgi:thiamine-phosphate pyrophosphorylase